MQSILIVDYGMGNLRSVQKACEKVGFAATISGDPNRLAEADKLILPGVGAFRDAIARIKEAGLVEPLRAHIHQDKPFLGICLGLQLLFTTSHEDGLYDGLNFFPGDVVRFTDQPGLKIPHMGWNQLRVKKPGAVLHDVTADAAVYFVHSYFVVPRDASLVAAETDYPTPFCSVISHQRVWATQFHPEKSQRVGLNLLHKFLILE